ncbi:YitT family protein [Baia soyae]|uniref:Putative 5xTM membrane YitT family protein n=1 Tax=Baia soyae TaxID=1544746 RepID=A0A4V2SWK6_9BACL|nr:YitT family protein [Baia soyae]TCP62736.1 putative 5xTM membrane YitT family protein [Baia soyae]
MRNKIPYQKLCIMLMGTFLLAFVYFHINYQNHLVDGGFFGLALLGKYAFGLSPSTTILLLDIPVILFILVRKEWNLIINTSIMTISFTLFYSLMEQYSFLVLDLSDMLIVASILSGLVTGLALGVILRYGGATGGDEILGLLLSKRFGLSIGTTLFIMDALVLLLSLFYLSVPHVLYTIIAVGIAGKVTTWIYHYDGISITSSESN